MRLLTLATVQGSDVCLTNFVCCCLSVALVVEQFRFSL